MLSRRALCAIVFAGVGACTGGTETGNPTFSGALSYTGYSSSPDVTVGYGTEAPIVSVERAWLSLGDVSLSPRGACADGAAGAVRLPALGVGDHAAGAHNFTAFEAASGPYCRAELPFRRVADAAELRSAPPELEQHSLFLEGRLADGTPLHILSAATPRVVLSPPGDGFALGDAEGQLLIAFDFAAWLRDLDFANAERVDGAIEISERVNSELLAELEANLSRGVALYRDRDGDGRLDDEPELLASGE